MNGYRNKYLDIFLPLSFRPYIHVYDLALITAEILKDFNRLRNNVFNIGFPGENYQKIKIAQAVKQKIPDVQIEIVKDGGDIRDYQVDFSKLHNHLKLSRKFGLEQAVVEILDMLKMGLIKDFDNPVYYNTSPAIQE
jgi:nucleoside-diphosphate-sugar epimerase